MDEIDEESIRADERENMAILLEESALTLLRTHAACAEVAVAASTLAFAADSIREHGKQPAEGLH